MHNPVSLFLSRAGTLFLWSAVWIVLLAPSVPTRPRPTRIAVLDFGTSPTGLHAAFEIRRLFRSQTGGPATSNVEEFEINDPDQSRAAALGIGFQGSLNLTLPQARDLGAAIGCDFYFMGDAQTLKRSPSTGPAYYESYASIFLVSARTGRLILWERPLMSRHSAAESERALLQLLASDEARHRYRVAIRRALEDERAERTSAIEAPAPIIEVMSDEDTETNKDVRAPRPYRRLKPPYPETAARAEVEAVVDVLADIDARGEVSRVEIARWAGYGLDQSVIDTVKQMHFFPAMRDGIAIPMRVRLRYNFRKPPPQSRSQ